MVMLQKEHRWLGNAATVAQALRIMSENGVASLPVYDNSDIQPLGMADVRVIAAFLAYHKFHCSPSTRALTVDPRVDFDGKPVAQLLSASSAPLITVPAAESVVWVMKRLVHGVRHVIVQLPPPLCAQRLLSRTDVVRWLCLFSRCFSAFGFSLAALGLVNSPRGVVRLLSDESALAGLRRLTDSGLGALPITDRQTGAVVGTLSCSVIRYMDLHRLEDLLQPSMLFLQHYHSESLDPVLCRPHETLSTVVRRILTVGVHRAWITDEAQRPIGCVSFSDVLRVVLDTRPVMETESVLPRSTSTDAPLQTIAAMTS